MKTLREYIDQLDEISRRDFLKGAGAAVAGAAVGQPKDATAHWVGPLKQKDRMTDLESSTWANRSTDGSADLMLKHDSRNGYNAILISNRADFRRPSQNIAPHGRLRIDGGPVIVILFFYYADSNKAVMIGPDFTDTRQNLSGNQLGTMIGSAKREILIDVSMISNMGILEFPVDRVSEDLEEASPDAIKRIEELAKYK